MKGVIHLGEKFVREACFPLILQRGKLTKKCRGAKLQVIEKKITGRSPLRFLRKCVGRNLISVRSLYPFDDATGQMIDHFLECQQSLATRVRCSWHTSKVCKFST